VIALPDYHAILWLQHHLPTTFAFPALLHTDPTCAGSIQQVTVNGRWKTFEYNTGVGETATFKVGTRGACWTEPIIIITCAQMLWAACAAGVEVVGTEAVLLDRNN
jgi:hypothetical protein